MVRCGKSLTACSFIKTGNKDKVKENQTWNTNKNVNCESYNVIYLLECDKDNCRRRYVG